MVTEAVLSNAPTDWMVNISVKQRYSEVTVKQYPLVFIDLRVHRATVVLHRTAPVNIVHLVVQGRLLHVVAVGRVVLRTGWDGVRGDVDAYWLATVDVSGGGGIAGRCGRTRSSAVGGSGRTTPGGGPEHGDVAAGVSQVDGGV